MVIALQLRRGTETKQFGIIFPWFPKELFFNPQLTINKELLEWPQNLGILFPTITQAGAAYLPLDVTFPENRVTHILQDSRPVLVLAHGNPQNLHQTQVPVLHLEDLQSEVYHTMHDSLTS